MAFGKGLHAQRFCENAGIGRHQIAHSFDPSRKLSVDNVRRTHPGEDFRSWELPWQNLPAVNLGLCSSKCKTIEISGLRGLAYRLHMLRVSPAWIAPMSISALGVTSGSAGATYNFTNTANAQFLREVQNLGHKASSQKMRRCWRRSPRTPATPCRSTVLAYRRRPERPDAAQLHHGTSRRRLFGPHARRCRRRPLRLVAARAAIPPRHGREPVKIPTTV